MQRAKDPGAIIEISFLKRQRVNEAQSNEKNAFDALPDPGSHANPMWVHFIIDIVF
jgi:hypothetical protein